MWLDGFQWDKSKERLSEWRIGEVVATRSIEDFMSVIWNLEPRHKTGEKTPFPKDLILAVACPYEKPRFTDAIKVVEEARDIRVMDIAELLANAM